MLDFFNNLSIRTRILLSLAVFMAVLFLASANAYQSIGANVDFARREMQGNLFQRPVAAMLR
ncbi:MAG TPA: hypothetical protein PLF78_10635, partial [Caulobacter sp.]|nr:hypothetical protein [Caulobacter sp.]